MCGAKILALLCASLALAPGLAAAEESEALVTQLRLAARNVSADSFAWRDGAGVSVEARALAAIGIRVPAGADRVALRDVPGLSYVEDAGASAFVITCTAACFETQILRHRAEDASVELSTAAGGYINYDIETQWTDAEGALSGGLFEAAVFGRFGLADSSWAAHSEEGVVRLETRWTKDWPALGLRMRAGDAALVNTGGAPVRFGGLQLGRHFALSPRRVTYPTPTLAGEAESASTVELYVNGALRARENVIAGPFAFEQDPMISGAGDAQIVVTDLLGRQQVISRPFFVATTMLRPGLSDWSVAAGSLREDFGETSNRYGEGFAAARYRRGLSNAFTAEIAIESAQHFTSAQLGAAFSDVRAGQFNAAYASDGEHGAASAAWYYDGGPWSVGLQGEQRDPGFRSLGFDNRLRRSVAANASVNMGGHGVASFTAAAVSFEDEPGGETYSLSYTPDLGDGALSFRLLYTDREERDVSFGVSYSFALRGDVSASVSADADRRGASFRASAQSDLDRRRRTSWRARAIVGRRERADIGVRHRNAAGESMAQAAYAGERFGVRAGHAGSVGWVSNAPFAGERIEGAFALVDAGAPGVSVSRERLRIGRSGAGGRVLATNLRPYDINTISIEEEDLPLDRALNAADQRVRPAEGAGVLVRFAASREQLRETLVRFADGSTPPRGAFLVRTRDNTRFPIGTNGRVVLVGAQDGDELALIGRTQCVAQIEANALEIRLSCRAWS